METAAKARSDFSREVESRRGWYGLKTNEAVGNVCGIKEGTMRRRLLNPDELTVAELRSMVQRLGLDLETVIRFIGYDTKAINKIKREAQA